MPAVVPRFVGRERYLAILVEQLEEVRASRSGRFVSLRGRRRVGKSRLVEEFLRSSRAPHVFFSASRRSPSQELTLFREELAGSSLPVAELVRGGLAFESWEGALTLLARQADPNSPSVVVIDELPYLLENDPALEGTLQKVWDRRLSRAPVLLIVVGSDVSMMQALSEYGHPLYGRPTREIVVEPFTPLELATMLDLPAAAAFDAFLVVGGFPLIAQSWASARSLWTFLGRALADPTSPLLVSGERMLAAEFPRQAQAREVLSVIGAGERTFSAIGRVAGLTNASLSRALKILVEDKRVVAAARPLSLPPAKETRYLVADSYLRFWLRFLETGLDEIERGRGDLVVQKIRSQWGTYRGKAVEPVIRASVERLLPDERFAGTRRVGSYWTRTSNLVLPAANTLPPGRLQTLRVPVSSVGRIPSGMRPPCVLGSLGFRSASQQRTYGRKHLEVDLVGLAYDEHMRPERVSLVGSIKWREQSPFGRADLAELSGKRPKVPGATENALLVAVSRSGFDGQGLDVALEPDELLAAWR